MPRPTMPAYFKDMTSYNVQLTKTTEEDLKEHFRKSSELYSIRVQADLDEQKRIMNMLYTENPYKNRNWRKSTPDRLFTHGYDTRSLREEKVEELKWKFSISREFPWSMEVYEWNEDWAVQFSQTLYRTSERYRSNVEEIKHLDCLCFEVAKQMWEQEDSDWIAIREKKKSHSSHRPKSYYVQLFAHDKNAKDWYKGIIPDNEDTCEFCIQEKRISDERDETIRSQEQPLAVVEPREPKSIPVVSHLCTDCSYTTNHSAVYAIHMKSKEHLLTIKKQGLFCKPCNHQSRTEVEHGHHLTTTKHRKNTGLIQPEEKEYVCECCQYKTPMKQNLVIHMKSNKHKIKSSENT